MGWSWCPFSVKQRIRSRRSKLVLRPSNEPKNNWKCSKEDEGRNSLNQFDWAIRRLRWKWRMRWYTSRLIKFKIDPSTLK